MRHSILELVPESRLVELRSLEVDPVLEGSVITEREFFIPLFLPDSVFLLERIKTCYRQGHVRKGE